MEISAGNVIAGIAFLLSGYATWKTTKLNNLLLAKERNEALKKKQADLGASFINIGSNNRRLKIWNKGQAAARNVRIEFPKGNEVVVQGDIDRKFPLELLDTFQSVELIASVHMGTKSKLPIRLIWDDDSGERNEKIVYPTI
jgi:glycosyltransferase involved in cell wall biosynthesis